MSYFIFLLFTIIPLIFSQERADVVKDLPGYPYKGRMYSGYLDLSDSLKHYHYMFVEAAKEPSTSPLILWLNGGPGCSSMSGFLEEIGPATFPEGEMDLKINENSWHKLANLVFLESPGNVGFSKINSQLEEELYIDDEITAEENFEAMMDFFKKFPSFKTNDFYISGESYAGIYIPMLAKKFVDYNKKVSDSEKIRLKGFLIGNGVATYEIDGAVSLMDFAFSHHLVSYNMRKDFNLYCHEKFNQTECDKIKSEIKNVNLNGLNRYDLMRECWYPEIEEMTEEELRKSKYYNYARWAFPELEEKRKKLKKSNKSISFKKGFLSFIEESKHSSSKYSSNNIHLNPPCMDETAITDYLNKKEVKSALHVDDIEWSTCSESVSERYIKSEHGSLPLYPELIKAGLKILIFNGDTDMAIPFNGNQRWIDGLKLEVVKPWRSWRSPGDDLNVAGYRQIYDGLTFVTFKGTGHMAVQWKAKDAFYMLNQYLNDKDL